jgi:outer membrane receptor for Fe3+-dicitrate
MGVDVEQAWDKLFVNLPLAQDTRLYGTPQLQLQNTTVPLDTLATAFYADATIEPGRGLTITPGLRLEYFRYVGQNRFTADPRLVVRWKITDRWAVKGGAGIYHRMQEPQLLDANYGNPNLPPIWAAQYSAGFVRGITDKLTLDTTFYYVNRYNQPVATNGTFEATGRGRSYGMELLLKHDFTERFYGWVAYTLSRAEVSADSVNGVSGGNMGSLQMPGSTTAKWYPTDFDQTHNLNVVARYSWRKWAIGARFRLVSGTPDTPIFEGVYDADSGMYACRQGAVNSTRKPTFNELDIRVDRTFTFNSWELGVYADIWNVYNATNPEFIIPDYRCRGSQTVRGIPFFPVLGVKGMF